MASVTLSGPFHISSRLMAAVKIAGATVQLGYSRREGREGRVRYHWVIDLPDGSTHEAEDLQSGACGGGIRDGFDSLLSFLYACGESVNYSQRTGREGENADLFPQPVAEWAAENSEAIGLLSCELEYNPDWIED